MKVLLINGSPHKNGETASALSVVEKSLQENGIDTFWLQIGNQPVRGNSSRQRYRRCSE